MGDDLDLPLPLSLEGTEDNLTTFDEKVPNNQERGRESLHRPLDTTKPQIRLIHLQPGCKTDEITCSLHLTDLDDKECRYEALSYEWGDPTNTTFSITLSSVKFPVRENLWWALWHLRDEMTARILWIDALCINQESASECNHQVQQMGRIYQRADQVVAWIGREHQGRFPGDPTEQMEDVELAASFLEFAYKRCEEVQAYNTRYIGVRGDDNHYQIMPKHPGWDSLLRICKRSYWSRLWIIQELVLASHIVIQCGKVQLKWNSLVYIFHRYRVDYGGHPEEIAIMYGKLEQTPAFKICRFKTNRLAKPTTTIQMMYGHGQKINGLFLMLNFFGEAVCARIHDKVFGLLGLSQECCREQLVVDYSVSPIELGKILFNHQISYHDSRGRLKVIAWRLRDTFLSLEPQPEQGNTLRTQISFQVSLTLVDTTFTTVVCRARGRIASLYGQDAMIGMMESVLPMMPDSTLMEEFLQHKSADHTKRKVTTFVTEAGYTGKAHGRIQVGDLVCSLNDGELVVLRQERQQTRVVGFLPWYLTVFPRADTSEAEGPKHLFLDYPALLTFCKLFDYEISFNCYPQIIKERKKKERESAEANFDFWADGGLREDS